MQKDYTLPTQNKVEIGDTVFIVGLFYNENGDDVLGKMHQLLKHETIKKTS